MPLAAEDLDFETRLRVLMMGPPKTGKTTCAIATAPGPVRVLLAEDISALREAKRQSPRGHFDVEPVKGWKQTQAAIMEAKKDAAEKRIQTLVLDPLSDLADRMLEEAFEKTKTQSGEHDGRRAYPECTKNLKHLIEQLFTMPCHVIVICHHMLLGPEMDGALEKSGQGIVPLLPGSARAVVAARFSDVVWFDLRTVNGKSERNIVTGPRGAWGPGCRSLPDTEVLPADITTLIERFNQQLQNDKANKRSPTPPTRFQQPKPAAPRALATKR